MTERLFTYSEVARMCGVHPRTIGEIRKVLGFPERRHPHNGLARSLTVSETTKIRRLLKRDKAPA